MPADRLLHPKSSQSAKVSSLTDLEFRVWVQYLLSADDFGVMQASAARLQADNRHLQNRPVKALLRCLEALLKCDLVRKFTHQGQDFLYSHNWQTWQKVDYPRATNNPPPSDLSACEDSTRALFEKHPGGQRKDRRHPEDVPSDSELASRTDPEDIPTTRAGAPAKRLTANGTRPSANGHRLTASTDFPGDVWFGVLTSRYPAERVTTGHLTQSAFVDQLLKAADGPHAAWERMQANLENQKRGHQWRVKGMTPKLQNWLESGAWEQQHEERPVAVLVNDKTAGTLAAAEAAKRFSR